MNEKPEVSVLIPTYNHSAFVSRAIRSVLAQTYTSFEIIIVDDGSTDDTACRIELLTREDSRVRYVRHEDNRGAQAARNTGIQLARGNYIALLDSDDEWLPYKLKRQMLVFQKADNRVGVVYAGYHQIFDDGRLPRQYLPVLRGNIYRQLLTSYGIPILTLIMKRECLEKAGFFNDRVRAYQEWDLCICLSRYAEFDYVPESLAIYHMHAFSNISKDLVRDAEGYLQVVTLHREEILHYCGRAVLSRHYRQAGQKYIAAHRFDFARRMFREAFMIAPLYPKTILHVSASLLGEKGYGMLRSVWPTMRYLFRGGI